MRYYTENGYVPPCPADLSPGELPGFLTWSVLPVFRFASSLLFSFLITHLRVFLKVDSVELSYWFKSWPAYGFTSGLQTASTVINALSTISLCIRSRFVNIIQSQIKHELGTLFVMVIWMNFFFKGLNSVSLSLNISAVDIEFRSGRLIMVFYLKD